MTTIFREEIMQREVGHYIDGRYSPSSSGKTFVNVAPHSDEKLADVPLGDERDVARAAEAAKAALSEWRKIGISGRAKILRRVGDLILERADELSRLEALDTGKPISETRPGDIARSAHNFHVFADLAAHQSGQTFFGDDGSMHTQHREPLGVVGLITPWNLPLYLATWKIAPALAQGNTVVLKPAELTPMTATALGPLLEGAGVPNGVFNVVHGFGPESAGEALVKHPDVKALSFTGETTTGSAIMRAASASLKKLSFELGGKGASVVFADSDLDQAADTAARAAFRNQGQICLAGSRLIVQRSVAERVVSRVLDRVREIKLGDPLDPKTTMGSLISKEHRARVLSFVDYAKTVPGVELLHGGKIPSSIPAGAYLEPTVFAGVPQDSRLIQEEIFGPVLTVQTFDDPEEALALANGTPYGLSLSVWTKDLARARWAAETARFGLVWINSWFVRDLRTPFGGMKQSGLGREGGQQSLDFFCEMKTVTLPPMPR